MLLAGRAVWWERRRALIVADTHLGKAAAFRAAGVPVPEVVEADLQALGGLIDAMSAEQLVVVGDLIHCATGRTDAVIESVGAWRGERPGLAITLIRGNHDERAGDPPRAWGFEVFNGPHALDGSDGVCFVHDPDRQVCPEGRATIGGHLHPSIVLSDGTSSLRAPCFWLRPRSAVLPAFGRFTGTLTIRPRAGDRVFVVGDDEVVEARTLARDDGRSADAAPARSSRRRAGAG